MSTSSKVAAGSGSLSTEHLRFILGLKLKSLRQARGASLKTLAGKAGLSISYLSEIEKGKKYPKPEKLIQLARALEVPFDELVSLKVDQELDLLKAAFGSNFLRGFPFQFFGLEPEDVFSVITGQPEKAGALIQTLLEVGKTYDVQVEHFLLAALRSYQQMNANYFEDLERAAAVFRAASGWDSGDPVALDDLRSHLERDQGYVLDEESITDHPELKSFRSLLDPGPPPRLMLNGKLLPIQKAFVLAREIGFLQLGLEERPLTSSWLKIESFDQVLNNFKASYFAGALLMDREGLGEDLGRLFSSERWDSESFLACMRRFDATPEMFLYRLTELAPELFGLDEIYFLRFSNPPGLSSASGGPAYELSKVFNLSRVPVPRGIGLKEHYCRRWPAIRDLERVAEPPGTGSASDLTISIDRCRFFDRDAEFLVVTLTRPLALHPDTSSSVSLGFLVNEAFKRVVRFWNDPEIPTVDVDLTCERCSLDADTCRERAAPPELHLRQERQERRARAVAEMLDR